MHLWTWSVLLFTGVGVLYHANVVQSQKEVLRMNLEKQILKHTVEFIKNKLVKCLKDVSPGRTKRKAHLHLSWVLQHDVEMSVLENTKTYLKNRLLECLEQQDPSEEEVLNRKQYEQEQKMRHRKQYKQEVADKYLVVDQGYKERGKYPEGSLDPDNNDLFNNKLDSGRSKAKYVWSYHTTTTVPTTTAYYVESKRKTFTLNGRVISCKNVTVVNNSTGIRCRDLWIDHRLRLPNYDLCPLTYDPDAWRQLNFINKKTFKVLDLKSLCQSLGDIAGVWGYVLNVKVAWDCGLTENRITWLDGEWQGFVKDNGFLRDLECSYDNVVNLP